MDAEAEARDLRGRERWGKHGILAKMAWMARYVIREQLAVPRQVNASTPTEE